MSAKEVYQRLVFTGGLPPGYVLDRMPFYEIGMAMEGLYMKTMEGWEQTRTVCMVTAQVNSRKRLKATDIMAFPWDNAGNTGKNIVTEDDVKRLEEKLNRQFK